MNIYELYTKFTVCSYFTPDILPVNRPCETPVGQSGSVSLPVSAPEQSAWKAGDTVALAQDGSTAVTLRFAAA